jgi:hypothetical protein
MNRAPRWTLPILAALAPFAPTAAAKRMLGSVANGSAQTLAEMLAPVQTRQWKKLAAIPFREMRHPLSPWFPMITETQEQHPLKRAGAFDFATYLPFDLCRKSDMAASVNSMELWPPMLDPSVVAAAWNRPVEELRRGSQGKLPLRKFLAGRIPRSVLRRRKRGFAFPIRWALLESNLFTLMDQLAEHPPEIVSEILGPLGLKHALKAYQAGQENLAALLFGACQLSCLENDLRKSRA